LFNHRPPPSDCILWHLHVDFCDQFGPADQRLFSLMVELIKYINNVYTFILLYLLLLKAFNERFLHIVFSNSGHFEHFRSNLYCRLDYSERHNLRESVIILIKNIYLILI
jgi:hypothetical protein